MTLTDARNNLYDYYDIVSPTEDDEIVYVESLKYLIEKTNDPAIMTELAWFYCDKKQFELELKYLELAAESGFGPAYEELGYMWYYGQHGTVDYAKAFEYYTLGAKEDKYGHPGSLWCKYKLADMYRFGCHVEKDEDKYRKMIEEAYEELGEPKYINDPYPEICYRLAGIRVSDGKTDEAVDLLKNARRFMAERLSNEPFWGHIEVMGRIVNMLYELISFNRECMDLYDMFYLSKNPGRYTFKYGRTRYSLEISEDDKSVGFEGKWYRSFAEFCEKAQIKGNKVTAIYDDLIAWEEEK